MNIFPDPKTLLLQPRFYSLFENSVGAKNFRRKFSQAIIRDSSGCRILDVGCGTADILRWIKFREYVGVDQSLRYIEYAKKKYAGNISFKKMDMLSEDLDDLGLFDLVLALGFFHHLPDPALRFVLKNIHSVLKPGGRLVSFDPCYHEHQSLFSKWFVSMDRGEYVRTFEQYVQIAREVFPNVTPTLWTGKMRIPYAHCVMEIK